MVLAVSLGAAVVVLAVVAYVVVKLVLPDPGFQQAVRLLPADTLRVSYTDWPAVASEADGTDIGASSKAGDIDAYLQRGFDKDITATSSLATSSISAFGR